MKFYTSMYTNINKLKNLNEDFVFVSISQIIPDNLKEIVDIWDIRLAPSKDILYSYKSNKEIIPTNKLETIFVKRFKEEILDTSCNPINDILKSWSDVSGLNRKYVLLCYEGHEIGNSFCHRHVVSEAIQQKYGVDVPELLLEDDYIIKNYKVQPRIEIDEEEW